MPPPAEASTATAFTCRCKSSCTCRNLESICWSAFTSIFMNAPPFSVTLLLDLPLHFGDSSSEALQQGLHHRIILKLRAQFLGTRCGAQRIFLPCRTTF